MRFSLAFSILLNFVFNISIDAQSLDFSDGPSLPKATSAITSAVYENDIYLVSGFTPDEQVSGVIYKLDGNTLEWSTFMDQSIPKRFSSAEVIENKLYILNGHLENGVYNTSIEIFDLSNGNVEVLENPFPRKASGISSFNGSIYLFGGTDANDTVSDLVYRFDTETTQWHQVTNMPIAMETKGDIIDGKLYIVGGYNGEVSDQILIYDIENNLWLDPISMPMANSANTVTAIGSDLYIVGDFANLSYTAKYNTSTSEFNVLQSNIEPRRHCAAANINGTLWVMGGNTASNISSALDNVQFVDILLSDNQLEFDTEISIAPNPASHSFHFSSPVSDIKITNVTGQIVLDKEKLTTVVNTQQLAPGVYFILGKSNNKLVSLKWIKQ